MASMMNLIFWDRIYSELLLGERSLSKLRLALDSITRLASGCPASFSRIAIGAFSGHARLAGE